MRARNTKLICKCYHCTGKHKGEIPAGIRHKEQRHLLTAEEAAKEILASSLGKYIYSMAK